jgi:DNA-directed RNA polymerase specialized sigma24 family protein
MAAMPRPPADLSARPPFDRLTAVRPLAARENGSVVWLCRCACGQTARVAADNLVSGHSRSCGCLKREAAAAVGTARRKTPPDAVEQFLALLRGGWTQAHIAEHFGISQPAVCQALRRAARRQAP